MVSRNARGNNGSCPNGGIAPIARKRLSSTSALTLAMTMLPGLAAAADWTGAVSNDWATAGNWDTNTVPTAGVDVIINNTGPAPAINGTNEQGRVVVVGSTVDGAALQIFNAGTLASAGAEIGLNNSGSVSVFGAGSAWTLNGNMNVGFLGTGTLNIQDGATVTNNNALLGYHAFGVGTAAVGTGASWASTGNLMVGQGGVGVLNIFTGGTVSAGAFGLGWGAGSAGFATVDGAGSTLTSVGDLYVGFGGTGGLTVTNGGAVTSGGGAALGISADAKGSVTVDGASSTWTATSHVTVGVLGTGTLTISNGGVVTSMGESHVGNGIGGFGTVTIDGAGSSWDNNGDLTIGGFGTGTVNISAGGALSNAEGHIGWEAGSSGSVTVSGAGSSWTNTSFLHVGGAGTGVLNIADGGVVTSGEASIGYLLGGSGAVTLTNGGQWNLTGNLFIGDEGTGTLAIRSGSVVANGEGFIGYAGGDGAVIVDGAGSRWENAGLSVGASGIGELRVSNGGKVSATGGAEVGSDVGSKGLAVVTGTGSALTVSGGLVVGQFGEGALAVADGGAVNAAGLTVAGEVGSRGEVVVTGGGSSIIDSVGTVVGRLGEGRFVVADGGSFASTHLTIGGQADGVGTVVVTGSGSSFTDGVGTVVGREGEGRLVVTDGGSFASMDMRVGFETDGVGTVLISGSSAGVLASTLTVGAKGAGTVTVVNGGGLLTGATSILGEDIDSTGTVTLRGANTIWRYFGEVTLGRAGTGMLTLADGAVLMEDSIFGNVSLHLAQMAGSTGTLNIGAGLGEQAAGAGTLQFGGLDFGAGTGVVNFNHTELDYTFIPSLNGNGTVNHVAGVTKLAADSSGFTGVVNVTGGRLYVNNLLGGDVLVTGGVLGGSGMLGAAIINAGGTVAPGNSIGTLTVADITFNPGSIYEVEVDGAGNSDLIVATGTATLNGGTVNVVPFPDYAFGTTYTILTANTLNGAFDTAVFNGGSLFVTPTLFQDANNVYISLAKNAFTSAAWTPNQQAAAGAADSLGAGNAAYDAILQLTDGTVARAAFDALSGEIHASARTALIEDSRFAREAAIGRLRSAFGNAGAGAVAERPLAETFALWGQGFGAWGSWDGDGNADKLERSIGGFFLGGDAEVADNIRLGVMGGYSRMSFDVDGRMSSGSADTYTLGAYGGGQWGALALRAGAALGWHDIDVRRQVLFTGFADNLSASYDARTVQAFGELGYGIAAGAVRFEPFAGLAYVNLHTDSFAERGGAAALAANGRTSAATFATLGVRAETSVSLGGRDATLRGTIGYRHAFGDVPTSRLFFLAGGNPFTVAGVPIARNALVLDAGLDVALAANATLGLAYGGQFGSGASDQSLKANISVKF